MLSGCNLVGERRQDRPPVLEHPPADLPVERIGTVRDPAMLPLAPEQAGAYLERHPGRPDQPLENHMCRPPHIGAEMTNGPSHFHSAADPSERLARRLIGQPLDAQLTMGTMPEGVKPCRLR